MSGGSLPVPVRRIGTRAVVRKEASVMAESDAASSSDPAPSAAPSTEPSDTSANMEPKLELKLEPMDTSPPEPAEIPEFQPSSIITLPTIPTTPIITSTLQLKENLLLQPLSSLTFPGRKRKANFSNEETETLVRDVVTHFSALYGSEALRTESTRRNLRRSQLWTEIQKNVNELGYTPRSIDDLKHKWRDLRLEVKRKITQRKTGSKAAPAAGAAPIIDTKLTAMEDLVASTIGHHCTLDGEQEGMFMEPGVPRQSIFFSGRGEMGSDMVGSTASPRPIPEVSVMSPLVGTSPAQLSFVHVPDDAENGERDNILTHKVKINPLTETWTGLKEVCTLVTTQNLIPAPQTFVTAAPEILTVKQEVVTVQPISVPARCESQNSFVSSPEGSLDNPGGQTECNAAGSSGGNSSSNTSSPAAPAPVSEDAGGIMQLKVEHEEGDSQNAGKASPVQEEDRGNWQENQDEWDRQSRSPPPSENVQEDSLPSSSSQDGDGDRSSGGELATNGDCTFDPDDGKAPWKSKMSRLLELEEQWDQLYHRELGIWEEERNQHQQQRNQDRELQQQLLGVLTDIRDELRELRQERAAARQKQESSTANGSLEVTNTSPEAITPKAESPVAGEKSAKSAPVVVPKRRGRPRLIRPAPEGVRPIRPAPERSTRS
ncbi:uncharacterized protein [Phyllobates terribilis]|uniref:uncharacterized protein n=1 Tax=Phyllobates terribilis TaxID=111132 RepID=UPI003CCACDA6